jgi:hypothetical protein
MTILPRFLRDGPMIVDFGEAAHRVSSRDNIGRARYTASSGNTDRGYDTVPSGPGPGDGDDQLEKRVTELEKNFLSAAVQLASIKTKVDDLPNKDWVHLRLWAIAAVIITAMGLMIRFLPSASLP